MDEFSDENVYESGLCMNDWTLLSSIALDMRNDDQVKPILPSHLKKYPVAKLLRSAWLNRDPGSQYAHCALVDEAAKHLVSMYPGQEWIVIMKY